MKNRKPWSQEEDCALMEIRHSNPDKKWNQIAHIFSKDYKFKQRTEKQCRDRYELYLKDRQMIDRRWSQSDENKLITLFERYGTRWSYIAKYYGGKTSSFIKNQFYSKLRKGLRNMNKLLKKEKYNNLRAIPSKVIYKLVRGKEEEEKKQEKSKMSQVSNSYESNMQTIKDKVLILFEFATQRSKHITGKNNEIEEKAQELYKWLKKYYEEELSQNEKNQEKKQVFQNPFKSNNGQLSTRSQQNLNSGIRLIYSASINTQPIKESPDENKSSQQESREQQKNSTKKNKIRKKTKHLNKATKQFPKCKEVRSDRRNQRVVRSSIRENIYLIPSNIGSSSEEKINQKQVLDNYLRNFQRKGSIVEDYIDLVEEEKKPHSQVLNLRKKQSLGQAEILGRDDYLYDPLTNKKEGSSSRENNRQQQKERLSVDPSYDSGRSLYAPISIVSKVGSWPQNVFVGSQGCSGSSQLRSRNIQYKSTASSKQNNFDDKSNSKGQFLELDNKIINNRHFVSKQGTQHKSHSADCGCEVNSGKSSDPINEYHSQCQC